MSSVYQGWDFITNFRGFYVHNHHFCVRSRPENGRNSCFFLGHSHPWFMLCFTGLRTGHQQRFFKRQWALVESQKEKRRNPNEVRWCSTLVVPGYSYNGSVIKLVICMCTCIVVCKSCMKNAVEPLYKGHLWCTACVHCREVAFIEDTFGKKSVDANW